MKVYARVLLLPALGITTATESLGPSAAVRVQSSTGLMANFLGFLISTFHSGWNLMQDTGPMFLAVAGVLLVAVGVRKRKQSSEIAD